MFLSGGKKRLIKKLTREDPLKADSLKHIQDASLLVRDDDNVATRGKLNRLEAYDISHFAGKETFGAMVVFNNGMENKNEYRLF